MPIGTGREARRSLLIRGPRCSIRFWPRQRRSRQLPKPRNPRRGPQLPPVTLPAATRPSRRGPTGEFSSALKIGAKCFVFSERFSTFVAPIFIALRVSQSDMTTQFSVLSFTQFSAKTVESQKLKVEGERLRSRLIFNFRLANL